MLNRALHMSFPKPSALSNVAPGLPKGHGIKRTEGPNSLIPGTRFNAIARGEGPNIELGRSGTNSLLVKYEEPVECLLYLEAALLGTS